MKALHPRHIPGKMISQFQFPEGYITAIAQRAVDEDIGGGDLTAELIPNSVIQARLISREQAILAGCGFFDAVFQLLDVSTSANWKVRDGDRISADQELCTITGPARAVLSAERSALNLLQTLSATATRTRRCVDIVAGTGAKILDTRKTIPGLRLAQKYAVVCGGGHNHRMGLYDGILIKENHLRDAANIRDLVRLAKERAGEETTVEIEVENLAELQAAVEAGAPRILLDNFSVAHLEQAVAANAGRALLEASGGIDESNLRAVATTGVDHISIGAITKDIVAVDFSMLVISPEN